MSQIEHSELIRDNYGSKHYESILKYNTALSSLKKSKIIGERISGVQGYFDTRILDWIDNSFAYIW